MTTTPKPKRFIVTLTDEQFEKLDAHRARLGLRSRAEVIRLWIDARFDGLEFWPRQVIVATPNEWQMAEPADPESFAPPEKSTGRRTAPKQEPKTSGYQVQFGPTKKVALKQPKR